MSCSDDASSQEWKVYQPKKRNYTKQEKGSLTSVNRVKYSQRFREKWLTQFHPWLAKCDDDPTKCFCRACQCRLDCNKCHLSRHERTTKHARNLEVLVNTGEKAAQQNLSIRQERSKYYQRRKLQNLKEDLDEPAQNEDTMEEFMDDTEAMDNGMNFQFVQTDPVGTGDQFSDEPPLKQENIKSRENPNTMKRKFKEPNSSKHMNRTLKKEIVVGNDNKRSKLLDQMKLDKSNVMDSFKDLFFNSTGIRLPQSLPKERHPLDIFFESVSSSIKALPLKLAAEAKMRVSQLLCELELRALTEHDGNQTNVPTPLIVSTEVSNVVGMQNHVASNVHLTQNSQTVGTQFVTLS